MHPTDQSLSKTIGDTWFPNHQATLAQHGPVTIVDWKTPGTTQYAIRYLMTKRRLYITGDVGDAVFRLTWPATIDSFDTLPIDYFLEKITAHSGNRWDFNTEQALSDLSEWKNLFADNNDAAFVAELDHLTATLVEIIENSGAQDEYVHNVYALYENESLEYFDWEDYCAISEFGRRTPDRFIAYLKGLSMASKQLGNDN